ncbi:MAG TPA: A/G-specific adenine glycosylase [Micrococcaceae bacterium]|jgi:A/G-specific adenine glycosylase|nr:A/G-specific adenine glycosylase [Micrococcaceae bacterium]
MVCIETYTFTAANPSRTLIPTTGTSISRPSEGLAPQSPANPAALPAVGKAAAPQPSPSPAAQSLPLPSALENVHQDVTLWFAANARDLPWRRPDCSAWGVLVSEVMLQQTPVVRVQPVWEEWLARWPTPSALAAISSGEAVRAWGRLGYPRRALRLHAAAVAITTLHDGAVPDSYEQLLSLPGVGTYTAAAVAVFAFNQRETVVDTNIRRVHARLFAGQALPAPALNRAETRLAEDLLPHDRALAVQWNAGVMELGALVCTARSPACGECPVREVCAWRGAGQPAPSYVPKGQPWAGSDRQVRGAVMAVLRAAQAPVARRLFFNRARDISGVADSDGQALWEIGTCRTDSASVQAQLERLRSLQAEESQLERAIDGLLQDGLAQSAAEGIRLPA